MLLSRCNDAATLQGAQRRGRHILFRRMDQFARHVAWLLRCRERDVLSKQLLLFPFFMIRRIEANENFAVELTHDTAA